MILQNFPTKPEKHVNNICTAQAGNRKTRDFGQLNPQRSQQAMDQSASLTRDSSTNDRRGAVTGERRKSAEEKTAPNLVEGSLIRSRDFYREAHLTSPSEVSQFMNNLNNQYAVRNDCLIR